MNGSNNQQNHPGPDQSASPKGPANRLIHESSPYLLQHAHNPVDWYPWGEEAFEKAVKEDKPVLVSIGYAACHWCHVMEKESFEDPQVAAVMNERFVNIKVDREERPDIDHIYMDAVQAITGSGGWPLNVFLTPSRKPFYGGTYFPPRRAFNRASWTEVLVSISEAYRERKDEVEQQAENLTQHLQVSNSIGVINTRQDSLFIPKKMDEAYQNIMKTADREWGGFGRAPKFPQTFTIQFLLNYSYLNKNEEARKQALLSLEKMMEGGIYDHVGGGFARYSTDTEWLVPHFEKMLYDNALLVSTLADAYRFTQKEAYKEVIEETLAFAERELMHPDGGFYSALDADSEGVEGKFYVWSLEEAKAVLGDDAGLFCAYFDITERGNWEGTNILRIRVPKEEFANQNHLEPGELSALIKRGKEKLLHSRNNRTRPLLDDKILLGWNALMNVAYSKAYAATGNPHYQKMAERNMHFLLTAFEKGGEFYHTWKNGQAKHPAFLDDYSHLIAALIELAQVTADYQYLNKARALVKRVIEDFGDDLSPLFFYTHRNQNDVLLRKKEIYDGATPSGNAVMAVNLYRLSQFYDLPDWRDRSEEMVLAIGEVSVKYPTSFGVWLSLLYEMISGTQEIAIVGKDWRAYLNRVQAIFLPHNLRMAAENPLEGYPLLADKQPNGDTLIYLCRNYACLRPVKTVEDLISLLSVK